MKINKYKLSNYRSKWVNSLKSQSAKKGISGLCGYVKNKKCIDCKKPTIKFNRCKKCYYKHRGWDYSHLLDKQKEGSNVISIVANEGIEILTDSHESFRSDSERKIKFPTSVTERLKHSERNWMGYLLSSRK